MASELAAPLSVLGQHIKGQSVAQRSRVLHPMTSRLYSSNQKASRCWTCVARRGDFDADTVMLPGACWCDPEHISAWSQALLKEKEIVLYCVHGRAVSNTVVDDLQ